MEKERTDAMEVEKEKNEKVDAPEKGEQEVKGAWGNQVS